MTISTARPEARSHRLTPNPGRRTRGGFSLVELLVALSIASVALAAVFSIVTFIARSSVAMADYADMDREARIGLEIFARDVRMASDVVDFSPDAVTLAVATSSGTTNVSYTFVPQAQTFYRAYGTPKQRALIKDIGSFRLSRYSIALDLATGQPLAAANHLDTKQLQLELRSIRTGPARASASNNVVSARYVLRNKVTH